MRIRLSYNVAYAGVAQLVEHRLPKAAVASSSLVSRSVLKRRAFVRVDHAALPALELAPDPRDAALTDRVATPLLMLPPAPEVHRQQDVHAEDVDDRDDEIHR